MARGSAYRNDPNFAFPMRPMQTSLFKIESCAPFSPSMVDPSTLLFSVSLPEQSPHSNLPCNLLIYHFVYVMSPPLDYAPGRQSLCLFAQIPPKCLEWA